MGRTFGQAESKLLPFRVELADPSFKPFWDTVAEARKEEDQRAITGSINVGFNGDQANGDSLFKLKTGATLNRRFYPAELRFSANLSLQEESGELG